MKDHQPPKPKVLAIKPVKLESKEPVLFKTPTEADALGNDVAARIRDGVQQLEEQSKAAECAQKEREAKVLEAALQKA